MTYSKALVFVDWDTASQFPEIEIANQMQKFSSVMQKCDENAKLDINGFGTQIWWNENGEWYFYYVNETGLTLKDGNVDWVAEVSEIDFDKTEYSVIVTDNEWIKVWCEKERANEAIAKELEKSWRHAVSIYYCGEAEIYDDNKEPLKNTKKELEKPMNNDELPF